MALTPIPTNVADPKDSLLWTILHTFEQIDEHVSSRIAFGSSIIYNAQMGMDRPLFEPELEQIRNILNIKAPVETEKQIENRIRSSEETTAETMIREL